MCSITLNQQEVDESEVGACEFCWKNVVKLASTTQLKVEDSTCLLLFESMERIPF